MTDYGSGLLGDWSGLTHNVVGDWGAADVGLIGDSITTSSWTYLRDRLAARSKTLAVNYWSGRPFAKPGGAAEWLMQQTVMPKRLVVACGTNDIFDPPAFAQAIATFLLWMEQNHPDTKIFWVDVQCRRWSQAEAVQWADQQNTGWVNQYIHAMSSLITVISWYTLLVNKKARQGMYLRDGVHPTTTKVPTGYLGTDCWAALIEGQLVPFL